MSDSDDSAMGDDAVAHGNNPNPTHRDNVILLTVECAIHYLSWHNLEWEPPIDINVYREVAEYRYFTPQIGRALVERCVLPIILHLVDLTNFNIEEWLEMSDEDAEEYVDVNFDGFLFVLPPFHIDELGIIYVWAYACYVCFRAAQINRIDLSYYVLDRFMYVMLRITDISEFYYSLHLLALAYNNVHNDRHNRSDDEGHDSSIE